MKIRIADRVFAALAGLMLLAVCGCVIAQAFCGVPVLAGLQEMLHGETAVIWLPYVLCAALLALGGYCVAMLFRRRKGKKGFVLQETDGGEVSIALSAMEGLVAQCVAVHEEMQLLSSAIETDHDGVSVDLRVAMANGVSVPLAVDALQKQIRQYVTSCSGVTVNEVRVQVDSMDNSPVESPYAVPAMLQSAVPAPLLMQSAEAAEEKPVHQRIFSEPETQEEAVQAEEPAEEAAEQNAAAEKAEEEDVQPEQAENSEETVENIAEDNEESAEEAEPAEEANQVTEDETDEIAE